jgi:hypothetical protein
MAYLARLRLGLTLCSMLTLAACEGRNEGDPVTPSSAPSARSATKSGPVHAPAGAQPGSHEDWCGEHQVPESLCTRCNASLVPAFKATGDWCPEHGLPESQCLICNPGLKIVRPPRGGEATP